MTRRYFLVAATATVQSQRLISQNAASLLRLILNPCDLDPQF